MDRFKKIVIDKKLEKLRKQGHLADSLLEQEISKYNFTDFMVSPSRAEFRVDGDLHSVDGEPAVVYVNDDEKLTMEMILKKADWKDILQYGEIGLTKEWYKNDDLHRNRGPARIEFKERKSDIDPEDFAYVLSKTWFWHGIVHNKNGPAVVQYYENGNLDIEKWYTLGDIRRDDNGPSIIQYYFNGNVARKTWYRINKNHRRDGPAIVEYYENGKVKKETWYIDNEIHREDGPAIVEYYEHGVVKRETWYNHGKIYRVEFPAIIDYYKTGRIKREKWYEHEGRDKKFYRPNGKLKVEFFFLDPTDNPLVFDYTKDGVAIQRSIDDNYRYEDSDDEAANEFKYCPVITGENGHRYYEVRYLRRIVENNDDNENDNPFFV